MSRRWSLLTVVVAVAVFVTGSAATGQQNVEEARRDQPAELVVKQDWEKTVYWVKPGKRELSRQVFGTPDNPQFTVKQALAEAKKGTAEFPDGAPGPVLQLIKDLPILVAAPVKHRRTNESGTRYTVFTHPTPFSDEAEPLPFSRDKNGYFKARLVDRVKTDLSGGPMNTHDEVEFETVFHDPDGNKYRVELAHLVQPPLPRYETGNGVILDRTIHGNTGTGTPLMPEEYTHAAFWAMGKLYVNGEYRGKRLTHLMTTQVVRNRDYELAIDEQMPLGPETRHIPDQPHHTHLMIPPVKPYHPMPVLGWWFGLGPTAPKFAPVPTAYELENGKKQPFIHVMFEQDEITHAEGVQLDEQFVKPGEPTG